MTIGSFLNPIPQRRKGNIDCLGEPRTVLWPLVVFHKIVQSRNCVDDWDHFFVCHQLQPLLQPCLPVKLVVVMERKAVVDESYSQQFAFQFCLHMELVLVYVKSVADESYSH